MPRKKPVLYRKTIYIFTPKNAILSTHIKHSLISTFGYLFSLSPDKSATVLKEGFKKAGLDVSFPKRSAHATYKKNTYNLKQKASLKPLETISNKIRVSLNLSGPKITEQDMSYDDAYTMVEVSIWVNVEEFPLWCTNNQEFIKMLGNFMSNDRKNEKICYSLLMDAVRHVSPKTEKKLIEETNLKFYKKYIGKPELIKPSSKAPLDTRLVIINVREEEYAPVIYLLIKPRDTFKYIPFRIHNSNRIHHYLQNPKSEYSVYATKCNEQITIELVVSDSQRTNYQAIIKQDFEQTKPSPFNGKVLFNKFTLWPSSLPDEKYTLVKRKNLNSCIIDFVTPNGLEDKAYIEHTIQRIHQKLSIHEFYSTDEPKMFTHNEGEHQPSPILLTWPCDT